MEIISIPVTPFEQNCRIVVLAGAKSGGEQSGSGAKLRPALIIDPGGDADKILDNLTKLNAAPQAIWLTHSHLDHCGGVADILARFKIPLLGHKGEALFRQSVEETAAMYGISGAGLRNSPEPTTYLSGGEVLEFGEERFDVLYVPGHSPGHLAFYNSKQGVVLAGDVLFNGSIGRTDLPGGNTAQLLSSIRTSLFALPDNTRVLAGHGPDTTIGVERACNPFLRD